MPRRPCSPLRWLICSPGIVGLLILPTLARSADLYGRLRPTGLASGLIVGVTPASGDPRSGSTELDLLLPDGASQNFNFVYYRPEYYNGSDSPEGATPVPVEAPSLTADVDLVLSRAGGTVSGQITAQESGLPLGGVVVFATKVFSNGRSTSFDRTDEGGNYQVSGLSAGDHRVTVDALSYPEGTGYSGSTYSNGIPYLPALTVAVGEGMDTPGVNFSLTLGGSISGRITSAADGQGISGAFVSAGYPGLPNSWGGHTDATGAFLLRGVPAGNYVLYAGGDEFLLAQSTESIEITAGAAVNGATLALATGGSIEGVVKHAVTMTPLAGLNVQVTFPASYEMRWTISGEDGHYRLGGLPSGWYEVTVPDIPGSTSVGVTAGETTFNADLLVDYSGCGWLRGSPATGITGRVTGSDGAGIAHAWIGFFPFFPESSGPRYLQALTLTDDDGYYSQNCLEPLPHFAQCRPGGSPWISEWFQDADSMAAIPIDVVDGQNHAGIDFILAPGGAIAGHVSEEGSQAPLEGVSVRAVNLTTGDMFVGQSLADGAYRIESGINGGLRSGNYRVWTDGFSTANLDLVPVSFVSFESEAVDDGIRLTWKVSDDASIAGFHVYRSSSTSVPSLRLTDRLITGRTEYRYTDISAPAGKLSYTLGAVDRSGRERTFGPFPATRDPVPATALLAPWPNPARQGVVIPFQVATSGPITIRVLDSLGRLVQTIADRTVAAGSGSVDWNGSLENGGQAPAGLYFVLMKSREATSARKFLLVR